MRRLYHTVCYSSGRCEVGILVELEKVAGGKRRLLLAPDTLKCHEVFALAFPRSVGTVSNLTAGEVLPLRLDATQRARSVEAECWNREDSCATDRETPDYADDGALLLGRRG